MKRKLITFVFLVLAIIICYVALRATHTRQSDFEYAAAKLLPDHATHYQDTEYYSGASLSISIPNDKTYNYFYGKLSHENSSHSVDKNSLFEIASITKSFTSAIMLQLEKEGAISLAAALGEYLPQYDRWKDVTLLSLMNMTSCLPNYSNVPDFISASFNELNRMWTDDQLIDIAYPKSKLTPPFRKGFYYSNTDYILAGKIIKLHSKTALGEIYNKRLFAPAGLNNTFYAEAKFSPHILSNYVHGYSYNPYYFPSQIGKDMMGDNLSSTGASGAIISTTEDITKWVKALFIDNKILGEDQKNKLMALVSETTGKPISDVSSLEPEAYGLGVSKEYNSDHPRESMWKYEGRMLGSRAAYTYTPCNKVIIAAAFNSSPDDQNDHMDELLNAAYELIIRHHPKLRC